MIMEGAQIIGGDEEEEIVIIPIKEGKANLSQPYLKGL
jgi:hypothetical protein